MVKLQIVNLVDAGLSPVEHPIPFVLCRAIADCFRELLSTLEIIVRVLKLDISGDVYKRQKLDPTVSIRSPVSRARKR